jgi:outer membrane protein
VSHKVICGHVNDTHADGPFRNVPDMTKAVLFLSLGAALATPWVQACPSVAAAAPQQALHSALQRVLCADPSLAQSQALLDERGAALQERAAGQAWRFSAQVQPVSSVVAGGRNDGRQQQLSASLQAQAQLRDSGLTQARVNEAQGAQAAQAAQMEADRQRVAQTWLQALLEDGRIRARVTAAEANLHDAEAALQLARARLSLGNGTAVEVLRAESAQAQAALERQTQTQRVGQQALVLAQRLGQPWPLGAVPLPALQAHLDGVAPAGASDASAASGARLPAQARQQAQLAAAEAALQAARAEGQGSLSATASLGPTTTHASNPTPGTTSSKWTGQVGLLWSRSLGDDPSQRARADQAQARVRQQRAALALLDRDTITEQSAASLRWQQAQDTLPAVAAALRAAQAAEAAARARLGAGAGTLAELLDAQASLAQARSQQAQAQFDALDAQLNLAQARGQLQLNPPWTP